MHVDHEIEIHVPALEWQSEIVLFVVLKGCLAMLKSQTEIGQYTMMQLFVYGQARVIGVVASRAHWQCTHKSGVAKVDQATRRLSGT